ncbi:MAG: ANTAR domain-containing protein, partial [Pseudonocardia sp.]|nr:ANTAR domain-containing protein [Pseudonocardia sp.]
AERTSVGAIFALPLQCATINLGVLDLYRHTPGPLGPAQLRDAVDAADIATMLLLGLRIDPTDEHPFDGAWGRRGDIHRAAGLLSAQLGIGTADALARLRAHAYTEHRLLADVARDVLARRLHITDAAGGPDVDKDR